MNRDRVAKNVRVSNVAQLRKVIEEDPRAAAIFSGDNANVCANPSAARVLNAVAARVREVASCAESWEEAARFVKAYASENDWVSHVVRLEISTVWGERALLSGDMAFAQKSFEAARPVYTCLRGATPSELAAFANNLAVMKELGKYIYQDIRL